MIESNRAADEQRISEQKQVEGKNDVSCLLFDRVTERKEERLNCQYFAVQR